jgi:hypothetical protein
MRFRHASFDGAVIEALRVLDRQLDAASVPLRFGTLVVFTDGSDRARRVSGEIVRKALSETDLDVYGIAVGGEINEREIRGICSPARAGQHKVQIEATQNGRRGRLEYELDARGFGPNCDPKQKPAFNVHRPRVHSLPGGPGTASGKS